MKKKIPVYQPDLSGNERKYVDNCIDTTWISSKGKYVKQFEDAFSTYIGTRHGISVSNGTVALQLGLLMLGIGIGDEVIVPTFTYIATINAIKYVGAIPVFVDSIENTWQINSKEIQKKITRKTKAIITVHLYGHPCDMDSIQVLCDKYNLYLIEDCAEAIGSKYKGIKVGNFGDVACFSFFGNKTITTGEGGMVLTNSDSLYKFGNQLKNQGLAEGYEYWHNVIGYNFRMTNICAAIGMAQLERIDEFINKKRNIAELYKNKLKDMPITFHCETENVFHTYWMNSILVRTEHERKKLNSFLENRGIETRPTFYPAHLMPMYLEKEKYPIAEKIGLQGMNLPSFPALPEEDVIYICECIQEYYEGCE